MDFWISDWISGFHSGFLDFTVDFWISGFQFGFLPTVYEISFVTDPSAMAERTGSASVQRSFFSGPVIAITSWAPVVNFIVAWRILGYWKTRNNGRTEYRNNGITFNYRK